MEIPSEYLLCMFTKEGAVSELLSSKKKRIVFWSHCYTTGFPIHSADLSVMKNLSFIFSAVSCEKACQLGLTLPFAKRPIAHNDNTILYLCSRASDNPPLSSSAAQL